MRSLFCSFLFLFYACTSSQSNTGESTVGGNQNWGLVIHGGAGTILKKNMTSEKEKAYTEVLSKASQVGYDILAAGGDSEQAVIAAIKIMEDSPLFNAGKGAVFTHDERNELDASIMRGDNQNAGAIAGVTRIKNPIELAAMVMNKSEHVMLAGEGAEAFAKQMGMEWMDPNYFRTEERLRSLKRAKEKEKVELDHNGTAKVDFLHDEKFGTVGCVALDKQGNLTAGTSTGGMTNKRWGRVGDAPIIGAGTYANNASCAVSATGWGEYFIRGAIAHDIAAMVEYKGVSLSEAAREVIQKKLPKMGGDGGIIAMDTKGNMVFEFNTAGMYRASRNAKGELMVGIYAK